MKQLPTFETDRLILCGVTEKDAPQWQKHFADYEVIRNLSAHVPWPYPDDGALMFMRNIIFPNQGIDKWVWGIFLKTKPDELIGCVDLWRHGKPEHRGFWLGPDESKKKRGQSLFASSPLNLWTLSLLNTKFGSYIKKIGKIVRGANVKYLY